MFTEQKEMLLKEYDELAGHLRTFWTIRASVLGVGLTLVGLMLKLSIDSPAPSNQLFFVGLLFLVLALIKMTGSLTRSLYIFSFRLEEIASQFQVHNFWKTWSKHVAHRPNDSGSYPYVLIMYFLNGLVFLFVAGFCILKLYDTTQNRMSMVTTTTILLASVMISAYSHYSVRREIDPSEFKDAIYAAWVNSHKEAYSERENE